MKNRAIKNILLINHYAGSPDMGMEFRPYYFAREWVKKGYRVDVIAASYSHLRISNPKINKDFEEQIIDGIHYHWIHTISYEGNGGKRALTMFQFVGKLWFNAKNIAQKFQPDVIITSSTYPLDTYVGQRIKKYTRGKGKLIHEIHDMWPIVPVEIGGMSPKHPFIKIMQKAEKSFCCNSDAVVSLLPCAEKYLIKRGLRQGKFVHVPNGILEEEWLNITPLPEKMQQELTGIKKNHKFLICFFGSITISYALDYLIDAMKQFNNTEVGLLIVGNGNYKNKLVERAAGMNNIYFFESISKKSVPVLLSQVDIIYIGAINSRMFRFGICMNKLFDSMMSGKPILYAVHAPNNYIKDYHCGISVTPESTEALVEGIQKLIGMPKEKLESMGKNGKDAVMQNFTIPVLSEKFERAFKKK